MELTVIVQEENTITVNGKFSADIRIHRPEVLIVKLFISAESFLILIFSIF